MIIIPRSSWGARPAKKVSRLPRHDNWFAHWEGTVYPAAMSEIQVMQSIQRFHMDSRGWRDIAYHFVIFNSGNVYEGAGWDVMGTATLNRNGTSHAFCMAIGPGQRPSPAALQAAHDLIEVGRGRGLRTTLLPHSAAKPTACPGPDLTPWALAYKHSAPTEGDTAMSKATVEGLYRDILASPADPEGLAFWTGKLDRHEMSVDDLRWHFLTVRLAADARAREAAATRLSEFQDPALVAKRAYDMFLADLRKLGPQS